jgi:hypothetical protein
LQPLRREEKLTENIKLSHILENHLSTAIIIFKPNRVKNNAHSKIRKPKPKRYPAVDEKTENFFLFSSREEGPIPNRKGNV